jgi:hypothetical protein
MIIPCYFLKSVPQIPKLTVLSIYGSQKCSRVFRPFAWLHKKCGREGFQRCAQVGQPRFTPEIFQIFLRSSWEEIFISVDTRWIFQNRKFRYF